VVNPFGVNEPMVGWKRAPLPVVASHFLVLISIFPALVVELEWQMITWTYAYVHL
jgi:hypothetical protein